MRQATVAKPKHSYAENFDLRVGEIAQEVAPIRKGNVARAENLFKARLAEAAHIFKAQLKYSDEGWWLVVFPDKSQYTPVPSVLPVLRKILPN